MNNSELVGYRRLIEQDGHSGLVDRNLPLYLAHFGLLAVVTPASQSTPHVLTWNLPALVRYLTPLKGLYFSPYMSSRLTFSPAAQRGQISTLNREPDVGGLSQHIPTQCKHGDWMNKDHMYVV